MCPLHNRVLIGATGNRRSCHGVDGGGRDVAQKDEVFKCQLGSICHAVGTRAIRAGLLTVGIYPDEYPVADMSYPGDQEIEPLNDVDPPGHEIPRPAMYPGS